MRGRGRGRWQTGRGGWRGRDTSFNVGRMLERAESDTSSLSDISLSALGSVDLSKESTLMKVAN